MNRLVALFVFLGFVAVSAAHAWQPQTDFDKERAAAEQGTLTAKGMKKPAKLISKDIIISKVKNKEPVEFGSEAILFEYGLPKVRPDSSQQLDVIAESLKSPELQGVSLFYVDGHTCRIGTEERNCSLSWARAREVIDRLVEKGVDRSKLAPRGFGQSSPKETDDTEEARQRNRRVVLLGRDAAEQMKGKSLPDRYEAGLNEVCRETTGGGNTPTAGPGSQGPGTGTTGVTPGGDPGESPPETGPGGSGSANSLKRRADNGDITAMCKLGDMYYFGEGVEQDYGEAQKWYREAVDRDAACARSKGFLETKAAYLKEKSLGSKGRGGIPGFQERSVKPGQSSKPESTGSRVKGFETKPVDR